MRKKMIIFAILILVLIVLGFHNTFALLTPSNASIQAKVNIAVAESCLNDMISRNIPITRANESFVEGVQLYSAQQALEEKRRQANYRYVNEELLMVCTIRDAAFKADDELRVFLDSYNEINKTTDLSSFEESYQKILASFNEERFEETPSLVDEGYKKMAEIQSQQTAFNVFYKTQARTIKNFVIKNWKVILITIAIILIVLIISWRTIRRALLNSKMNNLYAQREALNSLIKNLQRKYFEQGKISEFEYETKLKRYKEMALDIERQVPLLKEEIAKLEKPSIPEKKRAKPNKRFIKPGVRRKGKAKPKKSMGPKKKKSKK